VVDLSTFKHPCVAGLATRSQLFLWPRHLRTCSAALRPAAGSFDRVTETDGLDVTATPLWDAFPQGLLVMMDDQNAGFTTGFKLVNWADIAAGLPK
jgi:hypothetical protein